MCLCVVIINKYKCLSYKLNVLDIQRNINLTQLRFVDRSIDTNNSPWNSKTANCLISILLFSPEMTTGDIKIFTWRYLDTLENPIIGPKLTF